MSLKVVTETITTLRVNGSCRSCLFAHIHDKICLVNAQNGEPFHLQIRNFWPQDQGGQVPEFCPLLKGKILTELIPVQKP